MQDREGRRPNSLSRRTFFKVGGAAAAASALSLGPRRVLAQAEPAQETKPGARDYRTLGRTGFKVSDISMGCGSIQEANVIRYAYDRGMNYFDTAWIYGNGDSETKIGEAMQFMDRKQIFISTKLPVEAETTAQQLRDRFAQSLERLQTDYVDCMMMHGIADVTLLQNAAWWEVMPGLKADGKIRHFGVSCHGPQQGEPDSLEKVLTTAAADGRFDVFLMSYNFLNKDEAERVLAACKQHGVGTTAMKMIPARIEIPEFDNENPSEDFQDYIDRVIGNGGTREQAVMNILAWLGEQKRTREEAQPFIEKWGVNTDEQLAARSVQWVLQNKDMHTQCISMPDFDTIDQFLPLSGSRLDRAGIDFLRDYELAYGREYCRHGCTACLSVCPHRMPVSTIMRYAQYYARQGRQKFAMRKYARLGDRNALLCATCSAPCSGACPHGVNIQANLFRAHNLLAMA
jgi:predicted aldo/keto reductase-like oxidoreductase